MKIGIGLFLGLPFGAELRSFSASSAANLSTGLVTLPPWLSIACATAGRKTQVSASSVISGLAANAARARSVDGVAKGLSVEKASTNRLLQSNTLTGWTLDTSVTTTPNSGVAPDGTTTAALFDPTAAAVNKGVYPNLGAVTNGGVYVCSSWIATTSGSQQFAFRSAFTGFPAPGLHTFSPTWQRVDFSETAPSTTIFSPYIENPPGAAATHTGLVWAAQYELGLYPTSPFPCGASIAARAADVLSVPTPADVAPGGFFDVAMSVAPNYADSEMGADHNLVYFDANNRVYLQQSSKKLILRIGGVNVLSSALTWSRDQAMAVRATHTPAGRRLVVSGATTGNGDSGLQSSSAAISLPATAYLLGSNTGAEECADLRSLDVYRP